MAKPKRGSVEAFKAAEQRRQERLKKPSKPKSDARKEAFNKKVAAINKANTDQGSVKRFKAAEQRRQERLAKVNKPKYDSPKMKRQRAQADVEKDLPKTATTAGKVAGATAVGAAGAATKTAAKTATKKDSSRPLASPTKALGTFAEAFKKARAKGAGTKFAYNDKQYAAVTKEDISRAGKSNLREYLNTLRRKDMKIAKAPGQKAMGGVMKKRRGGMASPFEREQMERMIRSAKAAGETLQRPGMPRERLKERMREKAEAARDRNIRLKERMKSTPVKAERRINRSKGEGQVSDREIEFMMEQTPDTKMKSGGSVMARGCKMGRKKATKIY